MTMFAQASAYGDPLYQGQINAAIIGITLLKVVVCFAFLLIATMFMVWFERKVIAGMQNRIGPNKAGPFGILQTLADGIKSFFKEPIHPERADPFVFRLAPYLAFVPAFLVFTVIPVGGDFSNGNAGVVSIFGYDTYLQVADPPVGILFVLALSSIAVYGIMLAGWSSGSKYPLLGSVRASAQMVSYEAALGLSVATVLLVAGTLSTNGIVVAQDTVRNWNIIATGVLPFVVFVIAATAELNRPPFDLVEAEQELVGGFNTEYTGIRFAIFFLAEFMNLITMCAIAVTLFLGGPSGPALGFLSADNWINVWVMPVLYFTIKVLILLYATVWVRATLPRLRYDQLMSLGWKYLIELAFVWAMVSAIVVVGADQGWDRWITVPAAIAGAAIVLFVLWACIPRAGESIEEIR